MKSSLSPFGNSIFSVHGCTPSDFQPLHESFQKAQVYYIVFDDENINRRDCAIAYGTGGLRCLIHSFLRPFVVRLWSR